MCELTYKYKRNLKFKQDCSSFYNFQNQNIVSSETNKKLQKINQIEKTDIKIWVNIKQEGVRTWNGGDNFAHLKPI